LKKKLKILKSATKPEKQTMPQKQKSVVKRNFLVHDFFKKKLTFFI
jgi:hypothetical protein